MKKENSDAWIERQIIQGLIISDEYIKIIHTVIDFNLFQSKFTKIGAQWCIEYFRQYEIAPKQVIQSIYQAKKRLLDDKVSEIISVFLLSISDEFDRNENFNYRYLFDQTEKYFKKRQLEQLVTDLDILLKNEEISEAENIINNFGQIKISRDNGVDLFRDLNKIQNILKNKEKDVIFEFPGVLGKILNKNCRGELVAFSGPEKRGKSWWLQYSGMLAVMNGFNVAHFSLEMLEEQVIIRQLQYLTGCPVNKRDIGCKIPELDSRGRLKFRNSTKPLLQITKIQKKLKSLWPMIRGAKYKIVCWPPSTKSIIDIEAQLSIWEHQDNFIPDAIIIDHADRCLPKNTRQEKRHQIDSIWEDLKGLALKRYCLVLTATHTTKEAHNKTITKISATAEDKRKSGHVDRMIALNKNNDSEEGIMKLNTLFERNAAERGNIQVSVLHQFAIGKPYLDSFLEEK